MIEDEQHTHSLKHFSLKRSYTHACVYTHPGPGPGARTRYSVRSVSVSCVQGVAAVSSSAVLTEQEVFVVE